MGRGSPPWIQRAAMDRGEHLADFILSESRIGGISEGAIIGGISILLFRRLLVGIPDLAIGGGRYLQVFKKHQTIWTCVAEDTWVSGDAGAPRIASGRRRVSRVGRNLLRGSPGFFFLLRVGAIGNIRRIDVALIIDHQGGTALILEIPCSKTDLYSMGHVEVLRRKAHRLALWRFSPMVSTQSIHGQ